MFPELDERRPTHKYHHHSDKFSRWSWSDDRWSAEGCSDEKWSTGELGELPNLFVPFEFPFIARRFHRELHLARYRQSERDLC